jgi:enamine deaminase RidA (YjgF/YER057c/UK114 family)
VAPHQQALHAAAQAIAKEDEGRGGGRNGGRWFDGHSVVCHDARAVVIVVEEAAMSAEARLKDRGITLPAPTTPLANYVGAVQTGNLLFLSGHGPLRPQGTFTHVGKVGRDLTVEQGYRVAREVGLNLLATTRAALGSLDRVKRIVKVLGMVNSAEDFGDQPKVINGFSDLMVEVFGETVGRHARSAVGMAGLPLGIPVEIEMILEVE